MRALFSLIVLASFSTVSCADESCAVRATKLLSAGKISELAMWFKVPAEDAATKLKEAAEYLGPLEHIVEAKGPRSGVTARTSVLSKSLPSQYSFDGSWADAISNKVGPVQIQISSETGSACSVLALHIHRRDN